MNDYILPFAIENPYKLTYLCLGFSSDAIFSVMDQSFTAGQNGQGAV
jgi:hypothetical protein